MRELQEQAGPRIESGITAVAALKRYGETHLAEDLAIFQAHENDMGYGFLATRHAPNQDVSGMTDEQLHTVVEQTKPDILPNVFVTFWAFRLMVFLSLYFFVVFAVAAYLSLKKQLERYPLFLKICLWSIPLPVLATEFGWITAEAGRQPWTVFERLPTFMSASSHGVGYMLFSLAGFTVLYSIFIAAELYLMFKFARLGPDSHGTHEPENSTPSLSVIAH